MWGRYLSVDDLRRDLEEFRDIEFGYGGKDYSICPIDGRFHAGGKNLEDKDQVFSSIDELLDQFTLDGKPIKDVITEIEIYMH